MSQVELFLDMFKYGQDASKWYLKKSAIPVQVPYVTKEALKARETAVYPRSRHICSCLCFSVWLLYLKLVEMRAGSAESLSKDDLDTLSRRLGHWER